MSITFDEAMVMLTSMFPEVDTEVVTLLLKQNRGHLEKTIDNLLVMRGEKPINADVAGGAPGEADVSHDEEIARELQRRYAVRAMLDRQAAAERGVEDAYVSPEPEEDSEVLKEIKEKLGKLSETAKLKMRELWAKIKPANATPATGGGEKKQVGETARTTTKDGQKYGSVPTSSGDDDDDEVAFDSSLARRLKPVPSMEMDVIASVAPAPDPAVVAASAAAAATTTTTTTTASAPLISPPVAQLVAVGVAPSSKTDESKKDK